MPTVFVVGAGAIARAHAHALRHLPDPETYSLAVASRSEATRRSFAEEFPQARTFADAREMLAAPAIPDDIVIIATPPFLHAEMSVHALRTGRHVLCEKPLAMTLAEARRMLVAAQDAERLVGCCSVRLLGSPTTQAVRNLLRQGTLGRPYHLSFLNRRLRSRPGIEYQPGSRWFLDASLSGGGVSMDWGPYDFTTMNYVLAPRVVEVLGAWFATPVTEIDPPAETPHDVEQHVGAQLRFTLPAGDVVNVSYERSAAAHGREQALAEIEGERGAVRWDWLMWGKDEHGTPVGDVAFTVDRDGQPHTTTAQYRNETGLSEHDLPLVEFVRRLRGEPSLAVVNEQALFNFACVRALVDSALTRQPRTVVWGEV